MLVITYLGAAVCHAETSALYREEMRFHWGNGLEPLFSDLTAE